MEGIGNEMHAGERAEGEASRSGLISTRLLPNWALEGTGRSPAHLPSWLKRARMRASLRAEAYGQTSGRITTVLSRL